MTELLQFVTFKDEEETHAAAPEVYAAQILERDYIAQAFVPPSERSVLVNGEQETLKVDVQLNTYHLAQPATRHSTPLYPGGFHERQRLFTLCTGQLLTIVISH